MKTNPVRLAAPALALLAITAITNLRFDRATSVEAQARSKVNARDGLTYVWIPPGTFQMGCSPDDSECTNNEEPAHAVTITMGFWIGQTPVTQAAYQRVVGANPSGFKGDQLPVESVSWYEARAYCEGVQMRLPSEAEYEYAARGGSSSAHFAALDRVAWYRANSGRTTHEVGQKQANGYRLYDMLGNVWEWAADWYGPYDAGSVVDPKGPQTGQYRVLRGGSWGNVAFSVRVSNRLLIVPDYRGKGVGFRCAGN